MVHRLLALVVIIGEISCSLSQQHIKLTTSSSSVIATITAESDGPLSPLSKTSPGDLFKFEYISSKLFHRELTDHARDLDRSQVISTAVNVEEVSMVSGADLEITPSLVITMITTSTLSDVGLYKAVTRSPLTGGWQDKETKDLAPILQERVSSAGLLDELVASGLIQEGAALDLSFQAYTGSSNERGVTATETDILSEQKSGWLMFAAGFFMSLLVVTIISAAGFIYLRDSGKLAYWFGDGDGTGSVHYKGDIDVENATTASGLLGLIGHHPLADISNSGRLHRRRKKSSSQGSTDDSSAPDTLSPTNSQLTNGTSKRKKNPLGITSMSVNCRSSFRTPQKVTSGKLVVYNAERLTRT